MGSSGNMPNVAEFEHVCQEIENGAVLTFSMVTRVFGNEFAELLISSLIDAQDAARAIAGAMNRLATGIDKDDTE